MSSSESLFARAQQFIPGGVNSPVITQRVFNIVGSGFIALALGCVSHHVPARITNPPAKPFVMEPPRPENGEKILPIEEGEVFDADELKAAMAVRDYFKSREDVRYAVRKIEGGFDVIVYRVSSYHADEPVFDPGGFSGYTVSLPNWTVSFAYPGM